MNPNVILGMFFAKNQLYHSIESMNTLINGGVMQIITNVFKIEGTIDSSDFSDKTENDGIMSISYSLKITNPEFMPPKYISNVNNGSVALTPSMCRLNKLTYSNSLVVDMDLEIIAYKSNGTTEVRNHSVSRKTLTHFPTMVRSCVCTTNKLNKNMLLSIGEDPNDKGGYFIINGIEWTIENSENIEFNKPHVFRNIGYKNERARLNIISKPGDGFENSAELIIIIQTDNQIIFKIVNKRFATTPGGSYLEIPFYSVYRLFGMDADIDIIKTIVDPYAEDHVNKSVFKVIVEAFQAKYPDYKVLGKTYDQYNVALELGRHMESFNRYFENEDEERMRYVYETISKYFDEQFLQHMGTTPESRNNKLKYLGLLINYTILADQQFLQSTDRDSYANKRVYPAGVAMSKAFKTQYNMTIVQPLRRDIEAKIKENNFHAISLANILNQTQISEKFEKSLNSAITSSDTTIQILNTTVKNHVMSQMLHRKNTLNTINTCRTVIAPYYQDASSASERASQMRQVHPSFAGYICVVQSADTGARVGTQKQMAVTATITLASPAATLINLVEKEPNFVALENIEMTEIYTKNYTKIYVNGQFLGIISKDAEKVVHKFRMMRRKGEISIYTSVVWTILTNDIYIKVDIGRIVRPLLIVHEDRKTKLTIGYLEDLYKGKKTIDDLFIDQVAEWIDPNEQENCLICENVMKLGNALLPYTHCEIEASILGIVALTTPFANFNQMTRCTYQTGQAKQTCGWFATNWRHRTDRETILQYKNNNPIVRTLTNSLIPPNGMNVIVAVMCYGGWNQEDSLIFNNSAIERGLFDVCSFGYIDTNVENNEIIKIPDQQITQDININANYSKLEKNGLVKVGTELKNGDVVIGKVIQISPKDAHDKVYKYADKSLIYYSEENAIVENVVECTNQANIKIVYVSYRCPRKVNIGDKFSARSGQKGVCGMKFNQIDMPFTESGTVPDIIFNPHADPTRMTSGQKIEGAISKICALKGYSFDGTAFNKVDTDDVIERLEKLGFSDGGKEYMYNGFTGDRLKVKIFISPTYYQRLQKFVLDEIYAVASGPKCAITGQPISGKSSHGGIRLGEMERDSFLANNACMALSEKMFDHSDKYILHICETCQNYFGVYVVNQEYRCKNCKENASIKRVSSSVSAKLLLNELRTMNIGMKLELQNLPFTETGYKPL